MLENNISPNTYIDTIRTEIIQMSILNTNTLPSPSIDANAEEIQPPLAAGNSDVTVTPKRGGRPIGYTNESKLHQKKCAFAAKNELVLLYKQARKIKKEHFPKHRNITLKYIYQGILDYIKKKRNLPPSFNVSYETIRTRLKGGHQELLEWDARNGKGSPLKAVEPMFVELFIGLAKCRQCIGPGRGLQLINALIKGTIHQKKLIEFKNLNPTYQDSNYEGVAQIRYWRNFLERHGDKITMKKGKKYSLDRANWTHYQHFQAMYDHIEEELVSAGLATKLPEPIWVDCNGNEVADETKAKGMKIQVKLNFPSLVIMCDEVGSSTDMEGDGAVGKERFICAIGDEPRQLTARRDKHFTVLGLTLASGEPLMCVVLIQGKRHDVAVEAGILDEKLNSFVGDIEIDRPFDILMKNFGIDDDGNEKVLPGGPTCKYKGVDVPCFVRFTEGGGMSGKVLKEIFMTLDALKIFEQDRKEGRIPFMLLDGHQSRFDIDFLKYINDDAHEWAVCIGVPYGTAFWQVGDSPEQNGAFKSHLTKWKREKLRTRLASGQQDVGILPTDIIPMIRYAWNNSFARIDTNKRAIAERGWNPLNRALLLHPDIRVTMTQNEVHDEWNSGLRPDVIPVQKKKSVSNSNMNESLLRGASNGSVADSHNDLNFRDGFAGYFVDTIVRHNDLHVARNRVANNMKEGKNNTSLLRGIKKRITSGKMAHVGEYRLNKTVLEVACQINDKKEEKKLIAQAAKERRYAKWCAKADAVINNGKGVETWGVGDLRDVLKVLKRDGDSIPSRKSDMLEQYHGWKLRKRRDINQKLIERADHLLLSTKAEDEDSDASADEEYIGVNVEDKNTNAFLIPVAKCEKDDSDLADHRNSFATCVPDPKGQFVEM